MFGLGKKRTKFGKWTDSNNIKQIDIEKFSGLSRGTVNRLCNDKMYLPKFSTVVKLKKGLHKIGKPIREHDFW